MPLSISSSNQRIPPAPYGKLWFLVFCLIFLFIGSAELFLSHKGHLKCLPDDKVLWGMQVDKIRAGDVDVALVGASRMQMGLQVDRFEEKTKLRVANATVSACAPVPILEYIANETEFSGVVLVSFDAVHILYGEKENVIADEYVRWYRTNFLTAKKDNLILNMTIRNFLQKRLVFFSSNCGPKIRNRFKEPLHTQMMENRSRKGFYSRIPKDRMLEQSASRLTKIVKRQVPWSKQEMSELWREKVSTLEGCVDKIKSRGGRVVFIRFPTTGEYGRVFEEKFPRAVCWDTLGGLTGAETIHFKDYPGLAGFECPEGSHMEYTDSLKFTDALARLLFKQ